jgi:hypothetical protein
MTVLYSAKLGVLRYCVALLNSSYKSTGSGLEGTSFIFFFGAGQKNTIDPLFIFIPILTSLSK